MAMWSTSPQTKSSALEEAEGLVSSVQSRLSSAEGQLRETQTALQVLPSPVATVWHKFTTAGEVYRDGYSVQ